MQFVWMEGQTQQQLCNLLRPLSMQQRSFRALIAGNLCPGSTAMRVCLGTTGQHTAAPPALAAAAVAAAVDTDAPTQPLLHTPVDQPPTNPCQHAMPDKITVLLLTLYQSLTSPTYFTGLATAQCTTGCHECVSAAQLLHCMSDDGQWVSTTLCHTLTPQPATAATATPTTTMQAVVKQHD